MESQSLEKRKVSAWTPITYQNWTCGRTWIRIGVRWITATFYLQFRNPLFCHLDSVGRGYDRLWVPYNSSPSARWPLMDMCRTSQTFLDRSSPQIIREWINDEMKASWFCVPRFVFFLLLKRTSLHWWMQHACLITYLRAQSTKHRRWIRSKKNAHETNLPLLFQRLEERGKRSLASRIGLRNC